VTENKFDVFPQCSAAIMLGRPEMVGVSGPRKLLSWPKNLQTMTCHLRIDRLSEPEEKIDGKNKEAMRVYSAEGGSNGWRWILHGGRINRSYRHGAVAQGVGTGLNGIVT
jgi:hypothetical protein